MEIVWYMCYKYDRVQSGRRTYYFCLHCIKINISIIQKEYNLQLIRKQLFYYNSYLRNLHILNIVHLSTVIKQTTLQNYQIKINFFGFCEMGPHKIFTWHSTEGMDFIVEYKFYHDICTCMKMYEVNLFN